MKPDERKVGDLALAAYLSLRHPLVRIEGNGSGRAVFVFTAGPEVEADTLAFLGRKASIDPLTYAEQMRSLKGIAR